MRELIGQHPDFGNHGFHGFSENNLGDLDLGGNAVSDTSLCHLKVVDRSRDTKCVLLRQGDPEKLKRGGWSYGLARVGWNYYLPQIEADKMIRILEEEGSVNEGLPFIDELRDLNG